MTTCFRITNLWHKRYTALTYVSIHQLGTDVRLRILVLDRVEALFLVLIQCALNILMSCWLDVVDVVGNKNRVLHGIDSSCSGAGEELEKRDI